VQVSVVNFLAGKAKYSIVRYYIALFECDGL